MRIDEAKPILKGPVRLGRLACGDSRADSVVATLDLTLGAALDRWQGRAALATGPAVLPGATFAAAKGDVAFAGTAAGTSGKADIAADTVRTAEGRARRVSIAGSYRLGETIAFEGRVRAAGAAIAPRRLAGVEALQGSAAGSPVAPSWTPRCRP
ncbi:hypothetical protein QP185_03195 [Sphingomonas aerolata]|uniref:hypothetical protein n=1 Tax=Sphingomonas aerolata TaxID=185951 RepID=UPI002FE0EE46